MDELREEALEPNWARTLHTEILRTRQDNRVFFDWVCEVECKNAILVPVPSTHISDQQLRDHFEAQMDDTLAQRCQKDSIISITDYRTWTNAVKQEDKLLRQDLANARSVSLTVLAAGSRPRADMVPSTRSTSSTPAPSPLPTVKLSDEEKKILSDHDGCFKCRRPYAGRRLPLLITCRLFPLYYIFWTFIGQDVQRVLFSSHQNLSVVLSVVVRHRPPSVGCESSLP